MSQTENCKAIGLQKKTDLCKKLKIVILLDQIKQLTMQQTESEVTRLTRISH